LISEDFGMVRCEREGQVLVNRDFVRSLVSGSLLFALVGVASCRDHSAASPAPKETTQQIAKQPVKARGETEQEKDCREFVQGFYDWYFDRLNSQNKGQSKATAVDDVVRLKPELLTARLRQMLKEDRDAASKSAGEIVGLDFDPYINAQDWEGKYSVEGATVNGGNCRASVWGTDAGKKREMVDPELELTVGKWVFVNFHYPGELDTRNENLIAVLTGLREDRKHPHGDQAP
jgi:hypothetical protein